MIYTRVLLLWGTWGPGLTEIFKMISEHLNFISYKVHLAGNIEKKHKDLLVLKLLFCLMSGGGLYFSRIKENKLGLSSAKLRAQLASPARSILLRPSLYL